jgi:hypothetical protein
MTEFVSSILFTTLLVVSKGMPKQYQNKIVFLKSRLIIIVYVIYKKRLGCCFKEENEVGFGE